jgi:hypothetical protein
MWCDTDPACPSCSKKLLAATKAASHPRLGHILFMVNGGLGDAVAITHALVAARDLGYQVDIFPLGGNARLMNDLWTMMDGIEPVDKTTAHANEYEAVLCPTRMDVLVERAVGLNVKRHVTPSSFDGTIVDFAVRLVSDLTGKPVAAPVAPLAELIARKPGSNILIGPGVGPREANQAKKWGGWPDFLRYIPRPVTIIGDDTAREPWIAEAAKETDRSPERKPQVFDMIGKTAAIVDLLPIMAEARCYFGPDNGLGHLAAACGVPTATLFNFTNPAKFTPHGPDSVVIKDGPYAAGRLANVLHERLLKEATH